MRRRISKVFSYIIYIGYRVTGKNKRKTMFLLFLYILIGTTTVSAAMWQKEVRLGDSILIYHNDTLLYNITIDINRQDNHTYALIDDYIKNTGLVKDIDWKTARLNETNITIISTAKNLQKKIALIKIFTTKNYTIMLQSELIMKKEEQKQKNTTPANITPSNITPVNLTPVMIPENLTCNSVEECQQLINNLTAQLKQLKAERDELAKQLQYLQQQLNMTQTENEQLKKQIKILEQALEERNKRIRELEEEIAELQKQQWSWKTFREKSEEQYLLWTPYIFPIVLGSLVVYYRRYKRIKKYADVQIDMKAKELKEELLSEYLKKDLLRAKIETIVDDPNLLVILRTIIPQLTGSTEITKGDILNIDIDQVSELARKRFLLKENRVEYLKKKLVELKERIKEEAGGDV